MGFSPLQARELEMQGRCVGVSAAVEAATWVLDRLFADPPLGRANERASERFVLRVIAAVLPAAGRLGLSLHTEEARLTGVVKGVLDNNQHTGDSFINALRAAWNDPELVAMRNDHGFEDSEIVPQMKADSEKARAKQRADAEAHGLKRCALPSCDKREATVLQYKFCSACRAVWYCCQEHGALHWRDHKPTCRATTAAKLAPASNDLD